MFIYLLRGVSFVRADLRVYELWRWFITKYISKIEKAGGERKLNVIATIKDTRKGLSLSPKAFYFSIIVN